jgi:hypothetical protein
MRMAGRGGLAHFAQFVVRSYAGCARPGCWRPRFDAHVRVGCLRVLGCVGECFGDDVAAATWAEVRARRIFWPPWSNLLVHNP